MNNLVKRASIAAACGIVLCGAGQVSAQTSYVMTVLKPGTVDSSVKDNDYQYVAFIDSQDKVLSTLVYCEGLKLVAYDIAREHDGAQSRVATVGGVAAAAR